MLRAQVELQWTPVFENTNALAFALNPFNDNIMYATKSGTFYVTHDGGTSWHARGHVPQIEIRNIAVCPADTSVIIMYANGSLLRSSDGGFFWTEVLQNISMDGETIEFHPQYPDSVFYIDFLDGNLWVSGDRGSTWNVRANASVTHVCSFSINPYNPHQMIAGAGNTRVSRSDDGGYTWQIVKSGNEYFSEIPKIKWDPTNPGRAYASTYLDNYFSVFKSVDQGKSWSKPGIFGIPMWSLDIDPVNGNIYLGEFQNSTNCEIYKSYDSGNSWQVLGDIPGTAAWMIKTANDSVVTALTLDGFFGIGGIYRMKIPQLGYISGKILDSFSDIPIEFSQIVVNETGDKLHIGNQSGTFLMALPEGNYSFTITSGKLQKTINSISITTGDTSHLNIQLPVDIRYLPLSGIIRDKQGQPVPSDVILDYTTLNKIPNQKTITSDSAGVYQFDSLLSTNIYTKIRFEPRVLPYSAAEFDNIDLQNNWNIFLDFADIILANGSADSQLTERYILALRNAGLTWVTTDGSEKNDNISNAIVSKTRYNTLIWYDRHDESGINEAVRDSLYALMLNGNNLILSGQNMLEYNAGSALFTELGIGFSGNYTIDGFADPLNGYPGNAVGENVSFSIRPLNQNSTDIISFSDHNASAAFYYGNFSDSAAIAGITINDTGHGAKAVVMGFDLDLAPPLVMSGIISRSMDYFNGVLSLKSQNRIVPEKLTIYQNYPNPFNPQTTISFDLAENATITADIFSVNGQKVRTLTANQNYPSGLHKIKWDGLSDSGQKMASAVYYCRITTVDGLNQTQKMLLIR